MTNHIEYKQLISVYFDGEATPQEKATIDAHIKECDSCKKYYEDLHELSKRIKTWKNESLSPDLEQKINSSIPDAANREARKMKSTNKLFKTSVGGGVVITLVVSVLALHNYSQQAMQARVRDAAITMTAGERKSLPTSQIESPKIDATSQIRQFSTGNIKAFNKSDIAKSKVKNEEGKSIRFKSAKKVALSKTNTGTAQYEPYYLSSNYKVSKDADSSKTQTYRGRVPQEKEIAAYTDQLRSNEVALSAERVAGGMQASVYSVASIGDKKVSSPKPYIQVFKGIQIAETDESIMPYPRDHYYKEPLGTEQYDRIYENEFLDVANNPLSTFSIDVDTASYSNVRRFLDNGQMPPADSVRIEEMVNYFSYNYPKPTGNKPFSITTNASVCPWNRNHQLVSIGLQGKTFAGNELPPSNLVFLIDVSGSMNQPNKLPLLKTAYKMMAKQLSSKERVAIVVYAGAAGTVLESTPGSNKQQILSAIDNLRAGGSTAGGAGIQLAYKIARENFIDGGNNRVILATDGDFNVGISSNNELTRMIEKEREAGVFLTVLGFGTGNYKDARMEQIANKGNGNYYYIDTQREAQKVLVNELGSTLFTIAKDVKLQIEFNPAQVKSYKLLGYENRMLAKEDFNDDTKDAGELGAGHTVTALYEIVPVNADVQYNTVDELAYQVKKFIPSDDLMTVKLRYKEPDGHQSKLIKQIVNANEISSQPSGDFQFAAAVAEFGLVLRNSKYRANANYQNVINNARAARGQDTYGYRAEFIDMVNKASRLDQRDYYYEEGSSGGIQFKQ